MPPALVYGRESSQHKNDDQENANHGKSYAHPSHDDPSDRKAVTGESSSAGSDVLAGIVPENDRRNPGKNRERNERQRTQNQAHERGRVALRRRCINLTGRRWRIHNGVWSGGGWRGGLSRAVRRPAGGR